MVRDVRYDEVANALADTGMVARGGFVPVDGDVVPDLADGRRTRTVIVVGNIGGALWPRFRREERPGPDPLDTWTRSVLAPIAESLGAAFLHPSDEPFQPFQRWAQRADDVWPSPIGLLVHREHGLWHAYRGALLFAHVVDGLPAQGHRRSPCLDCDGQPCLTTCPVDAFTHAGYDVQACAGHIASAGDPACLELGCAARLACPISTAQPYGADQMQFHMRAFAGGYGMR